MKNKILILVSSIILLSLIVLGFETGIFKIEFSPQSLIIHSPENISYNLGNTSHYYGNKFLINVSSHFVLTNWSYEIYNLDREDIYGGDLISDEGYSVIENISLSEGQNVLTIYGTDVNGIVHSNNVSFFINVKNIAPLIQDFSSEIYVCENSNLDYSFNVRDENGDDLYSHIEPIDLFYLSSQKSSKYITNVSVFNSSLLNKSAVGIHDRRISVDDGEYVDFKMLKVDVIEINNPPKIEQISAQTISTKGENSIFNKTLIVDDIETGSDLKDFDISVSFSNQNLFSISPSGEMYFEANESLLGIHNVKICVRDKPLLNPHENISLCSQDGGVMESCIEFSISVVDENHPPEIIRFSPSQRNVDIRDTGFYLFEIEKYDPDLTIPDSYWYLDGKLIAHFSNELVDVLNYSFDCNLQGRHYLRVEITDGVLNDSMEWELDIFPNRCTSGGGSGGFGGSCVPNLVCGEWSSCQNSESSLEIGELFMEDYKFIVDKCNIFSWNKDECGFQLRKCVDLNNCGLVKLPYSEIQQCYFTENPSCFDGIKNCHDGSCETLTDCGGPCSPCASCSDGIQNQGELGIDCGGPCPRVCGAGEIRKERDYRWLILLIIFIPIMLLVIVIIYLYRKIIILKSQKKPIIINLPWLRYFVHNYRESLERDFKQ